MALLRIPLAGEAEHGPHRRAVGSVGATHPGFPSQRRWPGQTLARPTRDPRDVLNGILWILRIGAPWKDLPERYPPYQTCHRRFQRWIEEGVLGAVLEALAEDLKERGEIDLSECYIDATFVIAKKGGRVLERPSGARVRRSWRFQTALLFLSPSTQRVLHHTKSPLLRRLWQVAF